MESVVLRANVNASYRSLETDVSYNNVPGCAPTTGFERLLIMATLAVLPVEDHIPTVGNFSIMFILFGITAGYVLLNRGRLLNRTWSHPVFIAGYVLLLLAWLIETGHPNPWYKHLIQFAFMLAGGVFIATLCRDRSALRAVFYGYMIGSLWLSIYLVFATYGVLSSATATDYNQANAARAEATTDLSLEGNVNTMAFLAAQGGVVALALTLTASSVGRRMLFLLIATFCFLGSFLPMSRGGIAIAVISSAAVLFNCRSGRARAVIFGLVLCALMFIVVPGVVFQRFTTAEDSRAKGYAAAAEHVADYFAFGVGAGNFWYTWGVKNGFRNFSGTVAGAHNIFLQLIVNWGVIALFALFIIIRQAYRCIPKGSGNDSLGLCIPAIALSLFLMMFFSHNFYDKWYSMGLGMLVGVQLWIWPRGVVTESNASNMAWRQ